MYREITFTAEADAREKLMQDIKSWLETGLDMEINISVRGSVVTATRILMQAKE